MHIPITATAAPNTSRSGARKQPRSAVVATPAATIIARRSPTRFTRNGRRQVAHDLAHPEQGQDQAGGHGRRAQPERGEGDDRARSPRCRSRRSSAGRKTEGTIDRSVMALGRSPTAVSMPAVLPSPARAAAHRPSKQTVRPSCFARQATSSRAPGPWSRGRPSRRRSGRPGRRRRTGRRRRPGRPRPATGSSSR